MVTVSDAKVRAEEKLAKVQDALVIAEEARHRAEAEAEAAHLEVE